ncbi:hypothetical protein F9K33_01610 [bacterium]|nr:MAG: hypothetical protein F9K33_01610 [bacterium]
MKKYLVRTAIIVLFSISVSAVYLSCSDDETAMFFDLTGNWSGMAVPPNGAALIDLSIVQDTTGYVTGTLYIRGQEPDTATISGTVSNGRFTGTASNIECPVNVDLEIENDGTALVGNASGEGSDTCSAEFVYLTLYKDLPPSVNVTGTWSGTHSSTEGSGSFTMVITQSGETVSGTIYDEDTTAINGRVFGNAFAATISGSDCPILILMEVSNNTMNGAYANTGEGPGECLDKGTVAASRLTGKRFQN